MAQYYCEKCGRTMDENQFYTSNNLEKYPNGGKLHLCKKCLTLHVDNWDPETYKPILKEIDVPYIKEQWDALLEKYAKDPSKVTGMTILGRYLSAVKLKQWRQYRWADTEAIRQELDKKKIGVMRQQGYTEEEIQKELSIDRTPPKPQALINAELGIEASEPEVNPQVAESLAIAEEVKNEIEGQLTDEDKKYLRIKWGTTYSLEDAVKMEQFYQDMCASYDIQTAGHKDTLILICKASLQANKCMDIGDIEGCQKMSRVYDSLMKSGNFTAAQNKTESGEYVNSISELVEICEKQGFIPKFYTEQPMDKVDCTLRDLQNYTRTLVTEEMNLGNMIESSMRQIEKDRENESKIDVAEDNEEAEEEALFSEDSKKMLEDADYVALKDLEEESRKADEKMLADISRGN